MPRRSRKGEGGRGVRILARQPKTLPITKGRTPILLEKRPAFAKKILADRDYRVGVTLMYMDRDGQAQTEFRGYSFTVGRGNTVSDLRALKKEIGTWRALARELGVGERYLRKLRTGSEGKKPGDRLLSRVARVQKQLKIAPSGKDPKREFMTKAASFVYRMIREMYQRGAEGVGHSVDFVDRLT